MAVERSVFGKLSSGVEIERLCLKSGTVSATIITYGATLQALHCPDRDGKIADITLGHDALEPYEINPNFFGVTVGRYANRIAGSSFVMDGVRHQLDQNEHCHCLHGGHAGFDKLVWSVSAVDDGPTPAVLLSHVSPEGSGGFPGRLEVQVRYGLTGDGRLDIRFLATTSRPTIVNLTNHAVFNLGGPDVVSGIEAHRLMIPANRYTPVDADLIPTGELRPVEGSALDFRVARHLQHLSKMGYGDFAKTRGYNHNFVLDKGRSREALLAARLEHVGSGRVLEVLTSEPGIQIYGSNHLDGSLIGKGGRPYFEGQGIALEPQNFPDAPNKLHFPSARVDPGEPYRHDMSYRLSVKP